MIQKVEMYTVVCDNCGLDIGTTQEYSCWNDENYAESNAVDEDWIKDGDKHYCPKCYSIDDDGIIVLKSIADVTRGVIMPNKKYEIRLGVHALVLLEIANNEPDVTGAMDGWGNVISKDRIVITEM